MIRVLEPEANRRGDLFGRLMSDLFVALGYHSDCRVNIHKSGREVDLEVEHRAEPRVAVAECKATNSPIGGADLNKFAGVVQAERDSYLRRRPSRAVTGYYISLSGFTETGIEQEQNLSEPRFVMLDGRAVVRHLVDGRVLVGEPEAFATAGRLTASMDEAEVAPTLELVAHSLGWIWVAYFHVDGRRAAFTLIHADGQVLSSELAAAVVASDQAMGGGLHALTYVAGQGGPSAAARARALLGYRTYVKESFGEVTLEGMPADEDVGSRRFLLEQLYVPIGFVAADRRQAVGDYGDLDGQHDQLPFDDGVGAVDNVRLAPAEDAGGSSQDIGLPHLLTSTTRLAITGVPGAGKSTLLKHIALSYIDGPPADGHLPGIDWVPILLQCRSLTDARRPLRQILGDIPIRAEVPEDAEAFRSAIGALLRDGRLLLLVDGLDEIADDGERVAFVRQLRTLVATYPGVSLIVTSRPHGYRAVASVLAAACARYDIADLVDASVRDLVVKWHKVVVGHSAEVVSEADDLALTIIGSDRVRQLATNPLLLTTLLLVRRWVGDLPRKRAVLYGKAIEVLLMTWNVEAHDPVEIDEALPQLAYVAFAMTASQSQRVSRSDLAALLEEARVQMPETLAYTRTSVAEFVDLVEERSSLLMQSGMAESNGVLQPVYEFKHLTFQEYLTALAVVQGYLPEGELEEPVNALAPRVGSQAWAEIIPLAAVLAGRKAAPIIYMLLDPPRPSSNDDVADAGVSYWGVTHLLAQCLSDEVMIPPPLVERVSAAIAESGLHLAGPMARGIMSSRYARSFLDAARAGYVLKGDAQYSSHLTVLASVYLAVRLLDSGGVLHQDWGQRAALLLADTSEVERTIGAATVMALAYNLATQLEDDDSPLEALPDPVLQDFNDAGRRLASLLDDGGEPAVAAAWALSWIGLLDAWDPRSAPSALRLLFDLWRDAPIDDRGGERQAFLAWCFSTQPYIGRELAPLGKAGPGDLQFVEEQLALQSTDNHRRDRLPASLLAALYFGAPWTDDELRRIVADYARTREPGDLVRELWYVRVADALGAPLPVAEDPAPQ